MRPVELGCVFKNLKSLNRAFRLWRMICILRLVYARQWPLLGRLAYYLLKLSGIEMPRSVKVGKDLEIAHGGLGLVVHPKTIIGNRVKLYPGVGLGSCRYLPPGGSIAF